MADVYEFKNLLLVEFDAFISMGVRRLLVTDEEIAIETHFGDHYQFRKSDGYHVVFGGYQYEQTGRTLGFVREDGSEGRVRIGASKRILAALRDCGWQVEVLPAGGCLPRLFRRLRRIR